MASRLKHKRRVAVGPCAQQPPQQLQLNEQVPDATEVARQSLSKLRELLSELRGLSPAELASAVRK